MNIESHATPYGGTPQQRYATLHRAIEQGLDSDDVWSELAAVCHAMGHRGEAIHCVQRIRNDDRRARTERAVLHQEQPPRAHPSAAPAASHAGPSAQVKRDDRPEEPPGVVEHLVDACQYLMHQHMPMLVLTTMLAFPLVVGLGGFLTAGGSLLLLAAIAALPGLSVLSVVAAMGREILLRSSEGEGDVPELPTFGKLVKGARDFAVDGVLVTTAFFAVPTVMLVAGTPWYSTLPAFTVGALFAPLCFALRQVRRDMRAFSPVFLVRAVRRAGAGYPIVALASTLAFAPAVAVAVATVGHPVWVQIAIVGPLSVLPIFTTTRLLGSWLDTKRASLGYLMLRANETLRETRPNPAPQRPNAPRSLRRPEALERQRDSQLAKAAAQPRKNRRTAPPPRPAPASALAQNRTGARSTRAIEGRKPERRPAATPQTPTSGPAAPATHPLAAPQLQDAPDLACMPGAVVVSGSDRVAKGAAARRG